MNKTPQPPQTDGDLQLKEPALAALLSWLVPGLGHIYQGRIAKGVLFFVCLVSTFAYGCYLGGDSDVGWGRVVYVAWRDDDTRLAYLCQVGIGLPAMPAVVQTARAARGKEPWWNGFMAPPRPEGGARVHEATLRALADQPTLDALHFRLRGYFELGTAYTMIAGLLNILAVYDAWGGPVFSEVAKKEDDDEPDEKKQSAEAAKAE